MCCRYILLKLRKTTVSDREKVIKQMLLNRKSYKCFTIFFKVTVETQLFIIFIQLLCLRGLF